MRLRLVAGPREGRARVRVDEVGELPFSSKLQTRLIKNKIYLRCVERRGGGIIPMRINKQWPVEVACPVLSSFVLPRPIHKTQKRLVDAVHLERSSLFASGELRRLLSVDQSKELISGLRAFPHCAQHAARCCGRAGLLHAAHHHAHVCGFHDDGDTLGFEDFAECEGDLLG